MSKAPHTPGAVRQPAFFRPYTAVRDELRALERAHPDLVRVEDIGDSSEKVRGLADRDILAVRVTSPHGPARKPAAVYIAGVHPTETGPPELMARFLRELADGYGRDPAITSLLDSREVHVIPMVNPDGHAVVEEGYRTGNRDLMVKRKNTSPPRGVDLNRNWDWHWGQNDKGSSPNPASGKYRGPAPFSEPESRAVADYVARVRPGVFIDWHSPGKDVLYPWGDTKLPTPHDAGFRAIAAGIARRNGYAFEQASSYSNSQGTSDDWVYGKLGIPALTVETGTTSRLHDDELRGAWRDNRPVMDWAARIADAPYERAAAPDVERLSIGPRRGTVTARVSAPAGPDGQPPVAVAAVEAFTDPATPPGNGIALRPADGAFDAPFERALSTLRELQPAEGARLLYVRARDARGRWGAAQAQWIPSGARRRA